MRRPGSVWFTLHQGGAAIHTDDITNFPEDTDYLIAACLLLAACQSGPAVALLGTPSHLLYLEKLLSLGGCTVWEGVGVRL